MAADLNIVGHGIDLVDIAEMRRWIEDPRDPLIPRCFMAAKNIYFSGGAFHMPLVITTAVGAAAIPTPASTRRRSMPPSPTCPDSRSSSRPPHMTPRG